MKESELYAPVRDWLQSRGYTLHVEIFDADIVAMKDGKVTVVELKPCLSSDLTRQLFMRCLWADEVWGAIASEPLSVAVFRPNGWGLLRVVDGKVKVKIHAKPQPYQWHKKRAYRIKKLMSRRPAMPHEIAGIPSCNQLSAQRAARV